MPKMAGMGAFLSQIHNSYRDYDKIALLNQRALEMSTRELLDENKALQALFEVIPEIFIRINSYGLILHHNLRGDFFIHSSLNTGNINHIANAIPHDIYTQIEPILNKAKSLKTEQVFDIKTVNAINEYQFFSVRITPILDENLLIILQDTTHAKLKEIETHKENEQLKHYVNALTDVATDSDMRQNAGAYTETALSILCQTLSTHRSSLWLFETGENRCQCISTYSSKGILALPLKSISLENYSKYFSSLRSGNAVIADIAQLDPRTASLVQSENSMNTTHAILSLPLKKDGDTYGFLQIEHTEIPRKWKADEQRFCRTIAKLLTTANEGLAKQSKQAFNDTIANLKKVGAQTSVFIMLFSRQVMYFNPSAEALSGYSKKMLAKMHIETLFGEEFATKFNFDGQENYKNIYAPETEFISQSGVTQWLNLSISPLKMGGRMAWLAIGLDVTEEKNQHLDKQFIYLYDPLTGLANNIQFKQKLDTCFKIRKDNPDYHFGILYLKIEPVEISPTHLNHFYEDQLMIEIAQQLTRHVGKFDLVARICDNHFGIIADNLRHYSALETLSNTLHSVLLKPLYVSSAKINLRFYLGSASSHDDVEASHHLVRAANQSAYLRTRRNLYRSSSNTAHNTVKRAQHPE